MTPLASDLRAARSALALLLTACTPALPPPAARGAAPTTTSSGCGYQAPVTRSAHMAPSAAASSATPEATVAPPPWPGVACDDANAAPNLRFFACSSDCERGQAAGCDLLGDLHAGEEGLAEPMSSAGPAARAWLKACTLGLPLACTKQQDLLARLAAACRAERKEACVIEGNAIAQLDGEGRREQADALFQKACRNGEGEGCFRSAELHGSWEPEDIHQPISRKAYARACQLGSAGGCCAVEALYESEGNTKAAAQVRRHAQKIFGYGCGHGGPAKPVVRPKLELTIDAANGAVASDVSEKIRIQMRRRVFECSDALRTGKPAPALDLTLHVAMDPEGRVTEVRTGDGARGSSEVLECLSSASRSLLIEPPEASREFRIRVRIGAT